MVLGKKNKCNSSLNLVILKGTCIGGEGAHLLSSFLLAHVLALGFGLEVFLR